MTHKNRLAFGPSLLVATGIVASTFIAVLTARSGGWVLAAPLLLALAVVGADVMDSRLKGKALRPSWPALLLGGSFLGAGLIVALRDPALVKTLLPVLGPTAWAVLLMRPAVPRRACGGL